MSDKLKKFIQQSKSQFDLETPHPDLFNKIMNRVDTNQKTDVTPGKRFFSGIRWMAIAASITVLIICTLFYFFSENSIERNRIQLAEKSTVPTKNNISTADPDSHEATFIKESIPEIETRQLIHSNKKLKVHIATKKQSGSRQTEPKQTDLAVNNPAAIVEEPNQSLLTQTNIHETSTLEIPVDSVSNQQLADNQKNLSNETDQLKPMATELFPLKEEITSPKIQAKKEKNILSLNTIKSKQEIIADENPDNSSSLKSFITKGIFGFLSKKAKKWSGNTLTIENIDTIEHPILAVHYKGERVEFSKAFSLNIFGN